MAVSDLYRDYFLPWFGQGGDSSDVAMASRIRLARNFDRLPFPNRADIKQLAAVQGLAASVFNEIEAACGAPCDVVGIDGLSEMERQVLVEKYLVSDNFIRNSAYRSAYISANRGTSILVNEEDHLRIQCMTAGLNLKAPLTIAMQIDDAVESRLDLAFDEKMGYLTSCPTNFFPGSPTPGTCTISSIFRSRLAFPYRAFTEKEAMPQAMYSRYQINSLWGFRR